VRTVQAAPPNYDEVCAAFDVRNKHVAFTYGDTVYHPMDVELQDHVEAHEAVHIRQQGSRPKEWWDRYLVQPTFRLSQELEAYRAQYLFCKSTAGREKSRQVLNEISRDLSGSMYGNLLSFTEAKRLIKSNENAVL
jgi:hypothetical protein